MVSAAVRTAVRPSFSLHKGIVAVPPPPKLPSQRGRETTLLSSDFVESETSQNKRNFVAVEQRDGCSGDDLNIPRRKRSKQGALSVSMNADITFNDCLNGMDCLGKGRPPSHGDECRSWADPVSSISTRKFPAGEPPQAQPLPVPKKPKPRVNNACIECHRSKCKCDEIKPCRRCRRLGLTCRMPTKSELIPRRNARKRIRPSSDHPRGIGDCASENEEGVDTGLSTEKAGAPVRFRERYIPASTPPPLPDTLPTTFFHGSESAGDSSHPPADGLEKFLAKEFLIDLNEMLRATGLEGKERYAFVKQIHKLKNLMSLRT